MTVTLDVALANDMPFKLRSPPQLFTAIETLVVMRIVPMAMREKFRFETTVTGLHHY